MKKNVRALVLLVTVACVLAPVRLWADVPERSVLVLLDASYSMAYEPEAAGVSYYSQALNAIESLTKAPMTDAEWAFAYFEDVGHLQVVAPFRRSTVGISRHVFPSEPWGTTELRETIEKAARYVVEHGQAEDRVVLVLTDGVATEGELPSVDALKDSGARFAVYLFHRGLASGSQKALRQLAVATGGRVVSSGSDLYVALDPQLPPPEAPAVPARYAVPRRIVKELMTKATAQTPDGLSQRAGVLFWLFLALLILSSMAGLFLMAAPRRSRTPPQEPLQVAHLELRSSGDRREEVRLSLPATIGYGEDAQLRLEGKDRSKAGSFVIAIENGLPLLKTSAPMIIGGVKRREKPLKPNDILKYGPYRFRFYGVERVMPEAPQQHHRPSAGHAFASIALCFMFLFLTITQAPTSSRVVMPSPDKPGSGPERSTEAFRKPRTHADSESGQGELVSETVMVPPHAPLPPLDADALFIHAHPDDEAIDYGGLLARLAASGLKTVTVLLTDGESGLDQYPRRIVSAKYPSHDLEGAALSAVRIEEARAALSALGATHYVRLGLSNKPYHSVLLEESVDDVVRRWGGEQQLTAELAAIIQHYRPEILVSPDDASDASEHFEHEATGHLVARTLERFGPFDTVRVHLTCVDPLQRNLYPEAVGVPLVGQIHGESWDFRIPQARALKAHHTQRDSAVIGLEIRTLQRHEYYVPRYWSGPGTVLDYLLRP
jgi:LmbE family N-acetylglucosaminyl deacetylase